VLIAILTLAMMLGGLAAAAALIAGWSFLAALIIYSVGGLLSFLLITLSITTISALRDRRAGLF
jgi:fatty acid desaturase